MKIPAEHYFIRILMTLAYCNTDLSYNCHRATESFSTKSALCLVCNLYFLISEATQSITSTSKVNEKLLKK